MVREGHSTITMYYKINRCKKAYKDKYDQINILIKLILF